MNKKLLAYILGSLLLLIIIGIIVPKVAIKNPDLNSSPCAAVAVKAASRFPIFLFRTVKVKNFTIASVDMNYYTLFGIKLKNETGVNCMLSGDPAQAWTPYENASLGFSLQYPANLMVITKLGETEPDTVTFSFANSPDTLAPPALQIWSYKTSETDIRSWMAKQDRPAYATSTIVGNSIIDGQSAVVVGNSKGSLFIDRGRVWSVFIGNDISMDDAKQILSSFRVSALPSDSFDGKVYSNSKYGFSFDWNKQMYLSNLDATTSGAVVETPGAQAASGNLAMDTASGVVSVSVNKFTDLYKTQAAFCDEEIKLNPEINSKDCMPIINQAQLLQMKKDLAAKELTPNVVLRGDKKDTIPQFVDIKGGVGVLSTLYDFNGGWWNAHFTTLTGSNDLVDIYLFRPNFKTVQELTASPEYKTFVDAMKTFKIWSN
ncbi:MAG: hypothetical protein P4L74_00385 [Candidatus Doudnabacteria bacterium]|nr:hypothetical protein [Candidatus Doudnabacteria bacterium]